MAQQLEPPQPKRGWLDKRGEVLLKSWAHRYFTLDENGMNYYLDSQLKTHKGTIPLSSIINATTSQPPTSEMLMSSAGSYFQINTDETKEKRIYYLYCDSKEETTHWIIAINYWRDYASNSGFGNKNKQQQSPSLNNMNNNNNTNTTNTTNTAINSPSYPSPSSPYQNNNYNNNTTNNNNTNTNNFNNNYHDPSIPSAPPMDGESPYQRFLEYERIQNEYNNKNNNNNLNININNQNPVQAYNAVTNPPPYAPTSQVAFPVPPSPPRPLRTIDEQMCREILFTEGPNLKGYMDLSVNCCSFLMQQDLVIPGKGNERRMHVLCAYLIVASLDWDNRNTPSTPYWSSPAYENDNLYQYFVYLIAVARQEILDNWPMEGPTVVTQIDTWIKRKRKDHQALIQKEDRDAFLKRNLVILTYVRAGKLFSENSLALDACLVLIDRLLEAESQLPHTRFAMMVWKAVENQISEKDKPSVNNLLWSYLVFQKLKMEDDQVSALARDPFLTNAFTNVLSSFNFVLTSIPSLAPVMRDVQNIMMKIFGTWQRDLPLLSPALVKGELPHLAGANLRIVNRIMVKLFAFPQLYETFEKLKKTIEQRVGQEPVHAKNNTPFPSLPSYNPDQEDMTELGYIVRQALTNMHNSQ